MSDLAKFVGFMLLGVAMLGLATSGQAESRFALVQEDVVVFAGGTNMLHLQQAGHLEAVLTQRFAAARPKFRDWSWEADTVFRQGSVIERWRKDGFGARDDQLKRLGATVVIAQFGRLESMAGLKGLDEFTKAYEQLIDAFGRQARLIVLLTPTPFEKPPSALIPDLTKHNADLARYAKATAKIAIERKLVFVDLFTGAKPGLTDNGMHISAEAQEYVAREIARQLGVAVPVQADLEPLRRAVIEKHRLWYDYWRPANWKLLYGDDARRVFTRGGKNYIPFKEEWKKLIPLIAKAEDRVWQIAVGGKDPGHARPRPEVLHGDGNADVEKELAAFSVMDGLQVNLFASERDGLTSPLAIRWDPAGRMYVTVTTTYPHVFPGDVPNDKIIVLEDTDGDGRADKSTVFAEGLNIPTGLELGDGGVYVGQNTELLFLQDTDGDGRADKRRVVLGGLGNGDSHQTCNSFVWSPGGELYFGQGDGCESRVETPWGPSNLFQAGFYRFRPRRLQLHPLLDDFMGPGNPWGVAFDRWGQIFSIDGAGGVTYLSPGQIPSTHRLRLGTIGRPGGYCGIDSLDGRNFPESLRGDFVVGDFKSNRIKRFSVKSSGSGFSLQWKEPILQSRHRNFRPVDVRMGPDGALYIVDWYNPITCHQDDAYRDPTRDKAHGRIWRVSAKAPAIRPPNLLKAPIDKVLDALKAPEHWTRYQAKRALTQRDTAAVAKALGAWVAALDPKSPQYEHHLYEALGTYATIEVVEPNLLGRLLQANDPRARAYAARVVGRWHDRLDDPLDLLAERIVDAHPQVRMEAVMACAAIPSPQSIAVAARVIDMPLDRWLDYALTQTTHHLKPHWLPAFERGEVSFARPSQLAVVLNKTGGRNVLGSLKKIVESKDLTPKARASTIAAILAVGGPNELREYGLDPKRFTQSGRYDAALHAEVLARLIEVARFRGVRPAGDLDEPLSRFIDHEHPGLKANALVLAGIWKVETTQSKVLAAAKNESFPLSVRAAAFGAMADMKLTASRDILAAHAVKPHAAALRSAAIRSLIAVDMPAAAGHAAKLFGEPDLKTLDSAATLTAFLSRSGGSQSLASAIQTAKLSPASAKQLLRSLFSTGRSDPLLLAALNRAIGAAAQTPDFSEALVKRLVTEAGKLGDVKRGAVLFKSVSCVTCHKVSGAGGIVGPNLTAIGTTLSAERIVEELLWPDRQVKEGYSVVQVITDDGKIYQGYERRTKESQRSGDLVIQDITTQTLMTIKKQHIEERRVTGSPMPKGLTAVLSRSQLLDLVQYLSELGKIK
ncbi:MAG: HEAT repeat domain-containing protein [Planctomycetes bacterium]|nr:HEAT repeat domain-containing protein [Planctomycetota bacterium]